MSPYQVACPEALDAEFRSSDPGFAGPASQSIHGFGEVTFVAKAPGSTVLTAEVRGRVESVLVDVVPAPLSVDSIRVRLRPTVGDSALAIATDSAGNLDSLTLPLDTASTLASPYHWVSLSIVNFRDGDSTVYLPVSGRSSNPAVSSLEIGCWTGHSQCDLPWPATVYGSAVGTATITVEARGAQYSFQVRVVEN